MMSHFGENIHLYQKYICCWDLLDQFGGRSIKYYVGHTMQEHFPSL